MILDSRNKEGTYVKMMEKM